MRDGRRGILKRKRYYIHKQKNKNPTFWSKYKTHIAAVIPTVLNRNFASSQAAELCAFRRVSSLAYDFIEGRKITVHDFIGTILYFFRNAIPLALIGLAAGAVILVMLNLKCRREGKCFPKGQAVAFLLLLCYLGGLAAITLMNRMDGMRTGVQLLPFLAFWEAWNNFTLQIWLNPLLNIAMFLPLGVLLPLAVKHFRRWFWMMTAGVGTSLVIELLQYVLGRGQADVDDLICNVLGAMLGYCFCMLFVSLVRKQWKTAGAYAILPLLSIAALSGVFLTYHFQPYGNLADGPIYNAKTKEIEWVQECSLSNAPGTVRSVPDGAVHKEGLRCLCVRICWATGSGNSIRYSRCRLL